MNKGQQAMSRSRKIFVCSYVVLLLLVLIAAVLFIPGAVTLSHYGATSQYNLKLINIGVINLSDVHGCQPPPAICDKAGTPLLSWRVLVLPYIEESPLFKKFRLDEAWDSEHNKTLLREMPRIFYLPGGDMAEVGLTHYQVFVGPGTIFKKNRLTWEKLNKVPRGNSLEQISDKSNRITIVEAADPVPWTKPSDLIYDPDKPLPRLPNHFGSTLLGWKSNAGGFNAALADGSVKYFIQPVDEKELRQMISRTANKNRS